MSIWDTRLNGNKNCKFLKKKTTAVDGNWIVYNNMGLKISCENEMSHL